MKRKVYVVLLATLLLLGPQVVRAQSYGPPQEEGPYGTSAWENAWADYNGDGHLDIVQAVTNTHTGGPHKNTLAFGDGVGGFTWQELPWSRESYSVAATDYDLDGDVDVAVSNFGQNYLYVNDGSGNFTAEAQFGGGQTLKVSWGDCNGDGYPDLAVANRGPTNHSGEQNYLYTNNGNGTFTECAEFGTGASYYISWGDFDNDGDLDAAVANYGQNTLYMNGGDCTFTAQPQFGNRHTLAISWGDFDNDGDLDAAVANGIWPLEGNWGANIQNELYVNNSDGSFTQGDEFGMRSSQSASWGDVDGDGDLDLAVTNASSGQPNPLYVNNGDGTFTEDTGVFPGNYYTSRGQFVDLGGNGTLEFAIAQWCDGAACPALIWWNAALGDYVWHDANADGIQDSGEAGVEGVAVTLYRSDDTLVATHYTDKKGHYGFADLPPGDYYLVFGNLPSGYYFSPQDQGGDDTVDSDADPNTGRTVTLTLSAGQQDYTWDAGIYEPAEPLLDFGDAPDPPYSTLRTHNAARHVIVPGIFLGAGVDAEPDGQPDPNALGDDNDGNDDEDGVVLTTPLVPGEQATVIVTASVDGYLTAYLDFSDNGYWGNSGEKIFDNVSLVAGANTLNFPVPSGATITDQTFVRFRYSSYSRPGSCWEGEADDGEVEDYEVAIIEAELDFGDAPDPPYSTLRAHNAARHVIVSGIFLGASVDAEPDGQPDPNALGDDNDGNDDEDGVVFTTPLVPGGQATVIVTASVDGYLTAYLDFSDNGYWGNSGEKIFDNVSLVAGANTLNFPVPSGATITDQTFVRFRYSSYSRPGSCWEGEADDGEVEDYEVEIVAGDARISISPGSDTNDVGDSHTFVIHTEKKPGGSWENAAGVVVTVTFPGGAPGTVDTSDCDVVGTDANGECEVVINSSAAGGFTAHAAADIEVVSGFILHRETDGTGGNSGDAAKTYVDAKIELDPLNAANQVGDEHVITATVQVHDGTGWGPAPDGTTVTFSLQNNTAGAYFVGGVNTCLTSGGSCSVTINGNASGSVDIHAETDVSVGGLVVHRETDGTGSNSGDAQKIYVVMDYEISKTLNGPDAVGVGHAVSFTIRITNTGDTTITVLPLRDVYSSTYLTYGYTDTVTTWADPDSEDHNDDGEINWSDLTLTQGDLAPSASITVIVTFTAKADTTGLPDDKTENTAIVDGAKADPDGGGPLPEEELPRKEDSDRVQIVVPTGVVLGSLNGVAQPDGVLVSWETANEVRILGFNVLRRGVGGELEQVDKEFIFAEYAGADQGSDYACLDKGVVSGRTYDYVLEAVMSDGRVEQYDVPAVTARWWLRLPLIVR